MLTREPLDLLKPGRRVHLIGAGGSSMSSLAEMLHELGCKVSGSDRQDSALLRGLRDKGMEIYDCEDAAHVESADIAIRTAAAHDDNPEVAAVRERGIPLLERSEAFGILMKDYDRAVCVAGTHGKTTTTGMITHIALAAGEDPSVMIGSALPLISGSWRLGRDKSLFILEACEYTNSYHRFFPTSALLLNIESDHLDFFSGISEIIASFRDFALLVPPNGHIIGNADDENVSAALKDLPCTKRFGTGENADIRAVNISVSGGCYSFDIYAHGELYAKAALRVPGRHNMMNALAAAAACYYNGICGDAVERGLNGFSGTGRRLEHIGTYNGAEVYDDYAHHPTEIRAALTAAREMGFSRIHCAFQPHTFSRTIALFNELAESLELADRVYLAPIYAAREADTGEVSSGKLAAAIAGAEAYPGFEDIAAALRENSRHGELILTMGAGDINTVAKMLTGNC